MYQITAREITEVMTIQWESDDGFTRQCVVADTFAAHADLWIENTSGGTVCMPSTATVTVVAEPSDQPADPRTVCALARMNDLKLICVNTPDDESSQWQVVHADHISEQSEETFTWDDLLDTGHIRIVSTDPWSA